MVGDTEIARQFYAGRYAELIAATYDANRAIEADDLAFVVGALTFVDRVDDARALADRQRHTDPRTLAAIAFFLGLAAARAGYFDRSTPLLVREGFARRHDPDPWVRAIVMQGLACQCYFTGRYPGAARLALRALHAAHEASFAYAELLATDMRGHSLVQMGQLQRGIAMLEQAKKLAHRLGLPNNAFAVDTSIATHATRFAPGPEALDEIELLLKRRAHDSYSKRALLAEAARQRALRGHRSEAVSALAAADRDALRGDTRRGKVTSLLARMWVTRWQHGPAACRELLAQARELVEPRDVAFRAELLGFALAVDRGDTTALGELDALWKRTHHFAARSAIGQFATDVRTAAFDEDAVTPLLRAVAQRDQRALSRMVSIGWLGAIPELLGLTPGRRIILIPGEDLLLLEDHGDVVIRQRPPRWCPVLLRILARGDATKQDIVAGLWGLRAYHPEIHDPPVRTTIHRLRTFLAPYGKWIEVGDDGYRTAVPVHLVGSAIAETAPLWEEGEAPSLEAPREPIARVASSPEHLVLARLRELDEATVPQLAKSLELSASSVLRALRLLVEQRRVERLGFARATRYRPLSA